MARTAGITKKPALKKAAPVNGIVSFNVNNRTYQIDPERQKVYRSFVEMETSKACEIYSLWRAKKTVRA